MPTNAQPRHQISHLQEIRHGHLPRALLQDLEWQRTLRADGTKLLVGWQVSVGGRLWLTEI
jgi:hypothetical protein